MKLQDIVLQGAAEADREDKLLFVEEQRIALEGRINANKQLLSKKRRELQKTLRTTTWTWDQVVSMETEINKIEQSQAILENKLATMF